MNKETFRHNVSIVNRDPYNAGWFVKLLPTNLDAERGFLVDTATAFVEYQKKIEELKINWVRCID